MTYFLSMILSLVELVLEWFFRITFCSLEKDRFKKAGSTDGGTSEDVEDRRKKDDVLLRRRLPLTWSERRELSPKEASAMAAAGTAVEVVLGSLDIEGVHVISTDFTKGGKVV